MDAFIGDKLAARICAEQGYLVISSTIPFRVGTIVGINKSDDGVNPSAKVRVLSNSNAQDWQQQSRIRERLTGKPSGVPFKYFYRVEAVD